MRAEAIKLIGALKAGKSADIALAIKVLEDDRDSFRSGYCKEDIWRYLPRVQITEHQKERLRVVSLMYLDRPIRREFWYMCRFTRKIADLGLRSRVEKLCDSPDPAVRRKACLLLAYLKDPEQGEEARKEFRYRGFRK